MLALSWRQCYIRGDFHRGLDQTCNSTSDGTVSELWKKMNYKLKSRFHVRVQRDTGIFLNFAPYSRLLCGVVHPTNQRTGAPVLSTDHSHGLRATRMPRKRPSSCSPT